MIERANGLNTKICFNYNTDMLIGIASFAIAQRSYNNKTFCKNMQILVERWRYGSVAVSQMNQKVFTLLFYIIDDMVIIEVNRLIFCTIMYV